MPEDEDVQPNSTSYAEIGKMPVLRKEIDQSHSDGTDNISIELKKRMGVIDLIPCNFSLLHGIELDSSKGITENIENIIKKFKPTIMYKDAIQQFKDMQYYYGLSSKNVCKDFLRVYLTDSTTVQETISNGYTKSVVDGTINSLASSRLGQLFKSLYDMKESMGVVKTVGNNSNQEFLANITHFNDVKNTMTEFLTHGSRISFPKIWTGADYNPSLTCNIKLISPYGHPEAIAKFIIQPLGLLMLLLSPRTRQGSVTTRPNIISMKAYGMANLRLCSPSNIEIRRGGDDNSYNIYKQPMTVEVAITFDSISEGFAVFDVDIDKPPQEKPDMDVLKADGNMITKFDEDFEITPYALFSTMRTLVNSFRPYQFTPDITGKPALNTNTNTDMRSVLTSSGKEGITALSDNSFTITNDSETSNDRTILPTLTTESSETSLTFNTADVDALFEVVVVLDDGTVITEIIDPHNFTENDIVSDLSSISQSHTIEFNTDTFQNQTNFTTKFRNIRSDGMPGVWSDETHVQISDEEQNFVVEIIPSDLITTDGYRWTVENSTGEISGPYSYGAILPDGDYTLNIIDNNDIIIYEEPITVSSEQNHHEVIFDKLTEDLVVSTTIPSTWDSSQLNYTLISDDSETVYESSSGSFEEVPIGNYNMMVKYRGTNVLYDDNIYTPITITDIDTDMGTDHHIASLVIGDNFKITSISVS